MRIAPVSKTLSEILKDNFLQIPRFQRPYDWTPENVGDLWRDLRHADGSDYFMGSIVVYKDGKEKNVSYVVDGQQRITTITLLLASLRDRFKEFNADDLASGVQRYIQTADDDNKQRFVIAHEPPNKYLQDQIQHDDREGTRKPASKEDESLARAKAQLDSFVNEYISCELAGKSKATIVDRLRKLRDGLLGFQFIVVELDNEDDAYVIFETMNTRGKDLRVSDPSKDIVHKIYKCPGERK